jgi:hypothetical protein
MVMADDCFAPGFVEQLADAWGAGPRVFRDVLSSPVFAPRDIMDSILGATADYAADANTRYARVFVGSNIIKPEQVPLFLPASASESCDEYVRRITAVHPDFSFIVSACEKYSPAIRERFVPLLHGLFSRVGYPVRAHLGCLYMGTYKTTPFGIHTDQCHVVMCCGVGKKTMAFWPRSYFEPMSMLFIDNKVRVPVADHLDRATVIEIGPRDVLYWPANTWHVGVTETDDFHAALSLGIYHRMSSARLFTNLDFLPSRTELLLPEVEQYDRFDLDGFGRSITSQGRVSASQLFATPMVAFFEQWNRVREALDKPEEAEYRALQFVLTSLSSAGFGVPRTGPARERARLEGAVLQCPVAEALVVSFVRAGLLVGANGSLFFYVDHLAAIDALIADLRLGAPRRYDDLLATAGDARGTFAIVIQDLVDAGVLSTVVSSTEPARADLAAEVR